MKLRWRKLQLNEVVKEGDYWHRVKPSTLTTEKTVYAYELMWDDFVGKSVDEAMIMSGNDINNWHPVRPVFDIDDIISVESKHAERRLEPDL
jgi:hypothetical protein